MIELTRLNGHPIHINAELIKYVEASPDTMITLANGEKIVVLEGCQQVVERVIQYKINLLRSVWPTAMDALHIKPPHTNEHSSR